MLRVSKYTFNMHDTYSLFFSKLAFQFALRSRYWRRHRLTMGFAFDVVGIFVCHVAIESLLGDMGKRGRWSCYHGPSLWRRCLTSRRGIALPIVNALYIRKYKRYTDVIN